jgi:uncharacterized repeat protein (TIGR01451 family)
MRKKLLAIVIVSIVAVAVVVTGILLHWGRGPSTPSTLTILSMSEGNVSVMKAGTNSWIEAQVGMSLGTRDIIKSGDNSGAKITFFDGSTIELEAGTQIEVVSLGISDTGSTTIKLKQTIGDTISRVTKLVDSASRYEVETPACVAAVRGSVMLITVIEDGTAWVTNQEGNIWVIANGVELQIPEGRKCIITPGQPPQLVPLNDGGGDGGGDGDGGGGGGGGGVSRAPDIAVTKRPDLRQAHEGDVVTYTYTVTNPGHVPLSRVSVTDDRIKDVTYQSGDRDGDGRLDVGETWVFTASYNVTRDDVSPLVNRAVAAGTYGARTIIAWTTASVEILPPAIVSAIALNKTAEPTQAYVGDNITYTYTATNAGNMPLSDISVIDDIIGGIEQYSGDSNENEILDLGETWIFTATYTISAQDESPLVNNATVYGTYAPEQTVTAQASASVEILQPTIVPAIALNKTAEPTQAYVGDNITYTYTATNAGNMPLSDISVIDDIIGGIEQYSGDSNENEILDLGETWIFTATYTISAQDESPLVNNATVYGTYAPEQTVTAQANATVNILKPAIALTLMPDPSELPSYNPNSVNITWTYNVTNTGNTPLSDVGVGSEMVGDPEYQNGDTNGNSKLDTSETWTFIGYYTVSAGPFEGTGEWAWAYGTDALGLTVYADAEAYVTIIDGIY